MKNLAYSVFLLLKYQRYFVEHIKLKLFNVIIPFYISGLICDAASSFAFLVIPYWRF